MNERYLCVYFFGIDSKNKIDLFLYLKVIIIIIKNASYQKSYSYFIMFYFSDTRFIFLEQPSSGNDVMFLIIPGKGYGKALNCVNDCFYDTFEILADA